MKITTAQPVMAHWRGSLAADGERYADHRNRPFIPEALDLYWVPAKVGTGWVLARATISGRLIRQDGTVGRQNRYWRTRLVTDLPEGMRQLAKAGPTALIVPVTI
jgi:hypothetical protein